jgi:hypothetical protein
VGFWAAYGTANGPDHHPDNSETMNELGRWLATSSEARSRGGQLSVKVATKECEQTTCTNPGYLDTLAALCIDIPPSHHLSALQRGHDQRLAASASYPVPPPLFMNLLVTRSRQKLPC